MGWELIDHDHYFYWGGRKAVVVQFSRGCPYLCNYCGQRGFWKTWRHRNPQLFARELARLHREHGVEVINFADELPTGSRAAWQAFLEALIAENVNLILVGSTRAGDIVRDADILPLYKKAGVLRFLLGIESYDEDTLHAIRKDASRREDREAIRLLRQHGIISMATYVVGFEDETDRSYWRSLRQLLAYDPDQIQLLYATPHRWTSYFNTVAHREVVQPDSRLWDYKHQVLDSPPHAALARVALGQSHRAHPATTPQSPVAHLPQAQPRIPPRHAVVRPNGPPGLVPGGRRVSIWRTPRKNRRQPGGLLGAGDAGRGEDAALG